MTALIKSPAKSGIYHLETTMNKLFIRDCTLIARRISFICYFINMQIVKCLFVFILAVYSISSLIFLSRKRSKNVNTISLSNKLTKIAMNLTFNSSGMLIFSAVFIFDCLRIFEKLMQFHVKNL